MKSTMRARRGQMQPRPSVVKLLGCFLVLQGLIRLLVPGAQARVDSVRFLKAGYSCLSDLDLQ